MTITALAVLFLSAAPAPAGAPCAIRSETAIELQHRSIHIDDVVDLACLAIDDREAIANLELAQAPASSAHIELTHAAIANLARRRAPILADLAGDEGRKLLVRFADSENIRVEASEAGCFLLATPLNDGAIVTGEALAQSVCRAEPPEVPPLAFDRRSGVVRARGDLPAGVYLGRIDVPAHRYPDAGDALNLIVPIGPVVVQRVVVALEPAPRGGALFVRDEHGKVFSAHIPAHDGTGVP